MNAQITARFRLDYADFHLDVDLSLPSNGISVIYGPSGCGKTSLLRCIAGLQATTFGLLEINGHFWHNSDQHINVPTHQRSLGYVFQDNLAFGLKRQGKPWISKQHAALLELLGIESLLQRMPQRLSGGERQRVAIARALVLQPELLLMDEPLAALDAPRKQEILPYLHRLHNELDLPVLYVSHAQAEVAQLADYLVIMHQGKVAASGLPEDTLYRLDLSIAQDPEAVSVWQTTIIAHDADNALTQVSIRNHCLYLPLLNRDIGQTVRLMIQARDVSIALHPLQHSSILNSVAAQIVDIRPRMPGSALLQLSVDNQLLLAHITQKSVRDLNLHIGQTVFALIKGSSILN
jgi:molybdate transport system ATP-binding protein